ncbi:MAG: hypothetical protein NXI00_01590 [Cytophagales bacterium]|nr:hypothetical protein [Cytophagales bacterium]
MGILYKTFKKLRLIEQALIRVEDIFERLDHIPRELLAIDYDELIFDAKSVNDAHKDVENENYSFNLQHFLVLTVGGIHDYNEFIQKKSFQATKIMSITDEILSLKPLYNIQLIYPRVNDKLSLIEKRFEQILTKTELLKKELSTSFLKEEIYYSQFSLYFSSLRRWIKTYFRLIRLCFEPDKSSSNYTSFHFQDNLTIINEVIFQSTQINTPSRRTGLIALFIYHLKRTGKLKLKSVQELKDIIDVSNLDIHSLSFYNHHYSRLNGDSIDNITLRNKKWEAIDKSDDSFQFFKNHPEYLKFKSYDIQAKENML